MQSLWTKFLPLSLAFLICVNTTEAAHPVPTPGYHNFEQVLTAFDADLSEKQVPGLDNLAIRNVTLDRNLPKDLQGKIEALISKQILETAHTRLVHCVVCKTMNAPGGNRITTEQLKKMSLQNHIQNFMDIRVMQNTIDKGIRMNLLIAAVKDDHLVWSKEYQSTPAKASTSKTHSAKIAAPSR